MKKKIPHRHEMSSNDFLALKEIYGTEGWNVLSQYMESRRANCNEDILSMWSCCGSTQEDIMTCGIRTMALVSQINENNAAIESVKEMVEEGLDEGEKIAEEPKKIAKSNVN